MPKVGSLSGRVKKVPSTSADPNRYEFLDLQNAEPDLGVPAASGYVLTSDTSGNRTWFDSTSLLGYTGSIGFTGSQGFTGSIGFTGSQGFTGSIGFTGSKGDQGTSITIVGSVADVNVNPPNDPQATLNAAFPSATTGNGVIDVASGDLWIYDGSTWGNVGTIVGPQGFTGSQGTTGFTGSQGDIGYTGSLGFTGSQGVIGYTGSQGDQGFTGSIGFTGSQGDTGFTGSIGFTGSQGDIGYTGSQGVIGYTGSQGVIGYTGSLGFTGSKGDIGYTGSKGDIGYTGSIGFTGSRGPGVTLTAGTGLSGGGLLDQDRTISLDTTYTDGRYVNTSGDTMTGILTLSADPTSSLHAATKQYVDTIASASIHYHDPVRVESPIALTATYNNGSSGVGATLTNSGTQVAITIDGVTLSLNDRVLVYQQTNAAHNGVYYVSDVGSASTNWVLTRATDADSYSPSDPDSLGAGDAFYVQEGDTGAGELYVMTTTGTITFGTTNITFSQISSAQIYSAGSGLTLTGTEFSHTDTSSQASVNNSNGNVIQDITLDTFGHITALGSVDLDDRYYTETEADNRFVNVTGDTMSGALTVNDTISGNSFSVNGYGAVINSSGEWVGDPDTVRGYTGSIGFTGSQGVTGFTGSKGDIGYTGSKGDIGYTGSIGFTGSKGDIGYTGSKGDIGYTGSIGFTGSRGATGFTGSKGDIGYTGSIGFTGSRGVQGYTGSKGDLGYTGSRGFTGSQGPSTAINATNDTSATTHYPVFVAAAGSNQTPRVRTTSTALSYVPSTGKLTASILGLSTNSDITSATVTTTSTSQTAVASWSATTYGGAKVLVEAKDGSNRHTTELLITHNGTTAIATEYGSIWTSGSLATYDVDISGGNVRLLTTSATTNSTVYRVMQILMLS